jgi:glycosyltransferase involved in cell wall biosynthesis
MGDAEAMAKAIAILLADPSLAETMGRRGRERVIQRFTIEQVVEQIMDVYQTVAHR